MRRRKRFSKIRRFFKRIRRLGRRRLARGGYMY